MTAPGCLVVTGSTVDQSGVRVSQATLGQIEVGVTSEDWIIATLGEPSMRTTVTEEPSVAILRYEYSHTKASGGAVFLIFAGGSSSSDVKVTFFEVTDGVVTRYWTEGN